MFSAMTDASKVALAWLVARLKVGHFALLDCQFITDHLASLGASQVSRDDLCRVARLGARFGRGGRGRRLGRGGDRRGSGAGAGEPAAASRRRPTSARSTGCSRPKARPGRRARRASHRAALGPDVVDRMLDDVERRAFLVQPARKDALASCRRAVRRRAGRTRRSGAHSPTARSHRRRAGGPPRRARGSPGPASA